MAKKLFLIFVLSLTFLFAHAQKRYFRIDSLKMELKKAAPNNKAAFLNQITWEFRNSNPDTAAFYGKKAVAYADSFDNYPELAKAYAFLGVIFRNKGDFKQAEDYYRVALQIAQKHKLSEQVGYANINIGNKFLYTEKPDSAAVYLHRADSVADNTGNKRMKAYVNLNKGRYYLQKRELGKAEEYIRKALKFRIQNKDRSGQAVCGKYLGDINYEKGDFKTALENYKKSLKSLDDNFDKALLADLYQKKAVIYLENNEFEKAKNNAEISLKKALSTNNPIRILHAYKIHEDIYKRTGNYQKAMEYAELVNLYTDSLYSDRLEQYVHKLKHNFDLKEQKHTSDSIKAKNRITTLNLKQERTRNFALVSVLGISLLFIVFLIIESRRRKKSNILLKQKSEEIKNFNSELTTMNDEIENQKMEIEKQRDAIENQQIKITDSIIYAQRIQNAALPPDDYLSEILPSHFVLFRPRDIVSGDFYWARKTDNGKIIFTVSDCTGHGIPGAFVSMLGMSLLNELVIKQKRNRPDEILEDLRTEIKNLLRQSLDSNSQDDGMDMALCIIDPVKHILEFAGANNPAYLIRNDELIVLKAGLNPVGIYFREKPFEKQNIELKKGDIIYLFSDGYPDQFGGKRGRRFMTHRFRKLLLKIHKHPLHVQNNILAQKLTEWKGKHKQLDDITVMGVKIDNKILK